jgi:osmotically inducible lipoprotein OsmB
MRSILKIGMLLAALSAVPLAAQAGRLEGAGIGAGTGAIVLGPVGAVAGAVVGYTVGGPNLVTGRRCWRDDRGRRRCRR